jgi:hypothetical protein
VLAAIGQPIGKGGPPSDHKIIPPADIEERHRPAHDKYDNGGDHDRKDESVVARAGGNRRAADGGDCDGTADRDRASMNARASLSSEAPDHQPWVVQATTGELVTVETATAPIRHPLPGSRVRTSAKVRQAFSSERSRFTGRRRRWGRGGIGRIGGDSGDCGRRR